MNDQDEIVIQALGMDGIVYGLTTSGQLVLWDKDTNKWVLRVEAEILTVNKLNTLKRPFYAEVPMSRFRNAEEIIKQIDKGKKELGMITPYMVAVGILALSFLLYWYVK